MNEKGLSSFLGAHPEFKIGDDGVIVWYGYHCLLVLQLSLYEECSIDINDIMDDLEARGNVMTEADVRLILKARIPELKLHSSSKDVGWDDNSC
ncbi:hypothetical protein TCAL_14548 [Tigriopus californicus]|uniref:Uncharacterized protein n=1 Tax=Tigriopus californicus TaxID=6832 RepID=A0A553PAL4_TIGCA|nr:hypothetical protein TCAL_14548 [Tigriopus californicus]